MKWWDDIWLNEGFATWAANKPLAAWKPEWRLDVNAAARNADRAGPGRRCARRAPSAPHVSTPAADQRGVRSDRLREDRRRARHDRGLRRPRSVPQRRVVVPRRSTRTSNAAGEDFWMEMTRVTEKPVNRIMKSFVDQPGAPVLSVSRRAASAAPPRSSIAQQRFVGSPDADAAKAAAAADTGRCRCASRRRSGEPTCALVTEREQTLRAPGCGAAMVNADARGYYFTEYEPAAVAALATRTPPLTSAERISLLGDEWRMVRAGRHDIGTYLDLAAAFASDDTPAVAERPRGTRGLCRAPSWPTPASGLPSRPGCRRDSGPRSTRWPRPAASATATTPTAAAARCCKCSSSDPTVQQRARALAEGYLADPATLAADPGGAGAAGGGRGRRRRALRSLHGGRSLRRAQHPRSTTASSTRWRRSTSRRWWRARSPLRCHRKCARRTRRCCWRRCSRRRPRSRRPGRS